MKNFISNLSQQKAVTYLRFLFPIWAIVGMFSILYVPSKLIVEGDALATAGNIMANELLFRLSIVGSLFTQLFLIAAALLLYRLFKQVNKNQALLIVIFALVGVPIAMLNTLNRIAALVFLNSEHYLSVLGTEKLHTLAMFFLDLNAKGVIIASIFWGLWLFPYGYLVYKSGYFPRILGVLVIIAGFGYFLGSFFYLLLPSYKTIYSALEFLTIGETIFMVWILFRGAKLPKMKSPDRSLRSGAGEN